MEDTQWTPPILHRYLSFDRGFEMIRNKRLCLSGVNSYNDPFEFLPATPYTNQISELDQESLSRILGEFSMERIKSTPFSPAPSGVFLMAISVYLYFKAKKEYQNDLQKEEEINRLKIYIEKYSRFIKNIKVCCFSEEYNNVLLWSHYADAHKGTVVSLSASMIHWQGRQFCKVAYSNNRMKMPTKYQTENDYINSLITTKADYWAYEKEWRYIRFEAQQCPFFEVKRDMGETRIIHYDTIDPKAIKTITLGYKTTQQQRTEILEYRDIHLPHVAVRLAYLDDTQFKLRFEEK